ncbi:MAG: diaminopimelate epimerase [Clostridia bacterium]|nr:diaminopimelate epimerase [Clostridia bacterium]
MRFTKMHGIGNDYIYINCLEETVADPAELARKMSRYHFGVGSDGLVLICPGTMAEDGRLSDFTMRMFNSDGSESEMCGNASRCIGKYVYDRGLTDKTTVRLMTGAGLKLLRLQVENGCVQSVTVDMGEPKFTPEEIPVLLTGDSVLDRAVEHEGRTEAISCVSMGNPHCVMFVEDPDALDLPAIGPKMEHSPLFPRRVNVEYARVIDRTHIRMRVWERGSGETLACGTGACAVLAAAAATGRTERRVRMDLLGGTLELTWNPEDNHICQTGPAAFVFDGVWLEE